MASHQDGLRREANLSGYAQCQYVLPAGYRVRRAVVEDVPALFRLALSHVHNRAELLPITPETLARDCFGEQPLCYLLLIEHHVSSGHWDLVGLVNFCFLNSPFQGRVLFLEGVWGRCNAHR
jgi:hypothetical protein